MHQQQGKRRQAPPPPRGSIQHPPIRPPRRGRDNVASFAPPPSPPPPPPPPNHGADNSTPKLSTGLPLSLGDQIRSFNVENLRSVRSYLFEGILAPPLLLSMQLPLSADGAPVMAYFLSHILNFSAPLENKRRFDFI